MSKPYWWFQGASVRTLTDRLLAADPDTARLEVHLEGVNMTLRVVPVVGLESHTEDHINDSHVCPPQCT